jgi:signal transduction histidine kinase
MRPRDGALGKKTPLWGRLFMLTVSGGTLGGLVFLGASRPEHFLEPHRGNLAHVAVWITVVAAVELLPVPLSGVLRLSLSFPILLGVAMLYEPPLAAAIAFLGSFDSREIRRTISPLKAVFNRSQISASTWAESAVFHSLGSLGSPLHLLFPAVLAAVVADYLVNVSSVTLAMKLIYRVSIRSTFARLRAGALSEFLLSYLGLGLAGVVIARLYSAVQLWSVAAFILPLVFARQMFFRNLALEEASKELKDRERVLRALSNRMAEERQDERMQIAAYLHDDLAQMLFRLTLQLEMAKKRLKQGDVEAVSRDLDGITETKQQTSDAIRALIRDLHRSPIGRKGLAEAIESFAQDISRGHPTRITTDVVQVSLPPPIQLLIYQIAREAAMNALKHAEAEHIWITLREIKDGVELVIRDDGKGFDTEAPPPEGHFGTVMMRERAMVAGGTYAVDSAPGEGTTVTVTFPGVWVQEGTLHEASVELSQAAGVAGPPREPPKGSTAGPRQLVALARRRRVSPAPDSASTRSGPAQEPLEPAPEAAGAGPEPGEPGASKDDRRAALG